MRPLLDRLDTDPIVLDSSELFLLWALAAAAVVFLWASVRSWQKDRQEELRARRLGAIKSQDWRKP